MEITKYIALASCSIVMLFAWISTTSAQSDRETEELFIHFEIPKKEFATAEPIFVKIWIENRGRNTVHYQPDGLWRLNIANENGRPQPGNGMLLNLPEPELRSGQSSGVSSRNLLDYYGDGTGAMDYYLRPGDYTVVSDYAPSDTLRFHITNPLSELEKSALADIIWAAENGREISRSNEKEFSFFSQFVEKYPNSIYTPLALNRLIVTVDVTGTYYTREMRQAFCEELISRFPDSYFSLTALFSIDPSLVGPNQRNSILAGLKKMKALYGRHQIDTLILELSR